MTIATLLPFSPSFLLSTIDEAEKREFFQFEKKSFDLRSFFFSRV